MKRSIWYICQYAAPLKYGFGTRHFYLGEEIVKQGYNVTIFSANFSFGMNPLPPDKKVYNYENINGIDVWWIRVNRYKKSDGIGRLISWFLFMWRLFFVPKGKIHKPDIVIISSLSLLPIINGIYFKWRYKAKLIFEIRDIWPLSIIDLGNYSKHNPFVLFMRIIEKIGYNKSDYIVATMPKADLHISSVITKPFKFICIPQGIDPNILSGSFTLDPDFEERYIPKDKFIIGYAGAIGISNGLETIIDVAKLLQKSEPFIHFIFLGDGPLKQKMLDETADLSNVTFIPKINRLAVNCILKKCDVLYDSVKVASIYRFGLSRNKWMDYMYSGRPLIVSYTGYLSLINEANCGTDVPAEDIDRLKEILITYSKRDKKELDEEGKRGKEYLLMNRTFDVLANKYTSIFNKML